ncbi:Aste57867_11485 [Aphanomyces stellatus]|uniref:Aste57867_11485 protein n=1 Tax=Aphanomyces stellatus TaxID=120398 RepID=A0A485KTN0_9STRA|nr:hypothetical protein As57867_011442 [Aphanomyces stellatus]VFT88346.1 Aste57867_11485 [Aphanomyces stellatus]
MHLFLTSLLVATAAAAANKPLVVFQNLATDAKASGTPVTSDQFAAVQFRRFDSCGASLILTSVDFAVSTELVDNPSTYLDVDVCPSVHGVPACTTPATRIHVGGSGGSKRKVLKFTPSRHITLDQHATYWFVVESNAGNPAHAAIWLDGAARYTNKNDPSHDILTAFTNGDEWIADGPRNNRTVSSMQVVASMP